MTKTPTCNSHECRPMFLHVSAIDIGVDCMSNACVCLEHTSHQGCHCSLPLDIGSFGCPLIPPPPWPLSPLDSHPFGPWTKGAPNGGQGPREGSPMGTQGAQGQRPGANRTTQVAPKRYQNSLVKFTRVFGRHLGAILRSFCTI